MTFYFGISGRSQVPWGILLRVAHATIFRGEHKVSPQIPPTVLYLIFLFFFNPFNRIVISHALNLEQKMEIWEKKAWDQSRNPSLSNHSHNHTQVRKRAKRASNNLLIIHSYFLNLISCSINSHLIVPKRVATCECSLLIRHLNLFVFFCVTFFYPV